MLGHFCKKKKKCSGIQSDVQTVWIQIRPDVSSGLIWVKTVYKGYQERTTCRSDVSFAMRATSQLPGRGPLMWMMPMHLQVNQKSDYDDDMTNRPILTGKSLWFS